MVIMESRRNGPQLSSRHDDDDDAPDIIIFTDVSGADPEKIEEGFTGWNQGNI